MAKSQPRVLEDRTTKLRLELKKWELDFANTHDGRKPSKEEVKADAEISAMYKEYQRLRTGTTEPATSNPTKSKSKCHFESNPKPATKNAPAETAQTPTKPKSQPPSAKDHFFATPSKPFLSAPTPRQAPASITPSRRLSSASWDSPGRRRLFGHAPTRDFVGPTPQKSGRVLGLFDSFIDVSASPSPPTKANNITATNQPSATAPATPSRKRKASEILETPTFFRARPVEGVDLERTPSARKPRAPPKRGLSAMVQELRELEREREAEAMGDDEEALRDMMGSSGGDEVPGGVWKPKQRLFDPEPELPPPLPEGAFVEEGLEEEEEEEDGEEGAAKTRGRWKKRGMKRQHRRVVMRPVRAKAAGTGGADVALGEDEGMEEGQEMGEEQDIPPEIEAAYAHAEAEAAVSDSGSMFSGGEEDEDDEKPAVKRAKMKDAKAEGKEKKAGLVAKAKAGVKKINANLQSHMNFRKLNIKNKNSKGRFGGKRFGRR